MSRKYKIVLIVIGTVLIIGIASLLIYLNIVNNYREKVANTQISNVTLSEIPDGSYIGDYDVGFIYAKVEVTVRNGRITDIKLLEHKNGKGKEAERIIDDILNTQSLNVDAVSGATNSCIVIRKAIEVALLKSVK